MHRLDSHIQAIEPRICAICKNAKKVSELASELPEALTSYGWILLDSWVAWRTLRYLLRDTHISESVHEKWFQTPSSYNASQLKAIWRFEDSVLNYIQEKTTLSVKELFDVNIQKKRNASAHFSFTEKYNSRGDETENIQLIFSVLSKVFLFYEFGSFIESISQRLCGFGYTDFKVQFSPNDVPINADCFYEHIKEFSIDLRDRCIDSREKIDKEKSIIYLFSKGDDYKIKFDVNGCSAGKIDANGGVKYHSVSRDDGREYIFFENKGYYTDIDSFIKRVLKTVERNEEK